MNDPAVPAAPTHWNARSAWALALLLFALEITQTVLLLPLLAAWLGAADIGLWLALTSAAGLVNVAYSSFAPPQVRQIAQRVSGPRGLPVAAGDWLRLRSQGWRFGGGLLALLLLAFGVLIVAPQLRGAEDALAAAIYAAALLLRLRAFSSFVLFNGLQQVGRDKALQVIASALTLLATLLAAWTLRDLVSLAGAQLAGAWCLWWLGRRALRAELRHSAAVVAESGAVLVASAGATAPVTPGAPVAPGLPEAAEMRSLAALNLAGFTNLGTCVPLATLWLAAPEAVAFGFWFRAAGITSLLAGVHAQICFPRWAAAGWNKAAADRERRRGEIAWWALAAAVFAAAMAWSALTGSASVLAGLSGWTLLALCVNAAFSASCQALGQQLMARGDTRFIPAAVAFALSAPLLACAFAWGLGAQTLIGGFLIGTVCLRLMLAVRWARLDDQAPIRQ